MPIRPILKAGNPILRSKCLKINGITPEIRQIATDLLDTLRHHRALGIAAPQIGVGLRMIVVKDLDAKTSDQTEIVALNPILTKGTRHRPGEEGCLSFPGVFKTVQRATNITVEYTDLDGNQQHITAIDLHARAWQHEIEHLDGVLIIDK